MKKRSLLKTLLAACLVAMPAVQAETEEELRKYPLKECIVSGETLGEMGKPVYMSYNGQLYGFCCKPCSKEFIDDPRKFERKLKKLEKEKQNKKTQ